MCEQIGLFLISTRGCGSHSWKLLKTPICSRVQVTRYFSRTDRFPTQNRKMKPKRLNKERRVGPVLGGGGGSNIATSA